MSENIAIKAKSSLDKLRNPKIATNEIVNINQNLAPKISIDFVANETNSGDQNSTELRQKKVPFSSAKDNFIRQGISKHGNGR